MAISLTTRCDVTVGYDEEFGTYLLTPCCQASAKGSGDMVVCRACYTEVPEVYGGAASTTDTLAGALSELGCPCPVDCATHTGWKIDQELGLA